MDAKHIGELLDAAEGAGLEYKQLLVWVKSSAGMGSFYRSGHELIGVFKYGQAPSHGNASSAPPLNHIIRCLGIPLTGPEPRSPSPSTAPPLR